MSARQNLPSWSAPLLWHSLRIYVALFCVKIIVSAQPPSAFMRNLHESFHCGLFSTAHAADIKTIPTPTIEKTLSQLTKVLENPLYEKLPSNSKTLIARVTPILAPLKIELGEYSTIFLEKFLSTRNQTDRNLASEEMIDILNHLPAEAVNEGSAHFTKLVSIIYTDFYPFLKQFPNAPTEAIHRYTQSAKGKATLLLLNFTLDSYLPSTFALPATQEKREQYEARSKDLASKIHGTKIGTIAALITYLACHFWTPAIDNEGAMTIEALHGISLIGAIVGTAFYRKLKEEQRSLITGAMKNIYQQEMILYEISQMELLLRENFLEALLVLLKEKLLLSKITDLESKVILHTFAQLFSSNPFRLLPNDLYAEPKQNEPPIQIRVCEQLLMNDPFISSDPSKPRKEELQYDGRISSTFLIDPTKVRVEISKRSTNNIDDHSAEEDLLSEETIERLRR